MNYIISSKKNRCLFVSFFCVMIGLLFSFVSCEKDNDIKSVAPITKIETSITFKALLEGTKEELPGTKLELKVVDGDAVSVSGLKADKLISGYQYEYKISKDGYATQSGKITAKPAPFEEEVSLDSVSIKVNPYHDNSTITIIPVSDIKGSAKAGAVAFSLVAKKAKKLAPDNNTGFYKITVQSGGHRRDTLIDAKNASYDLFMPVGYYLTVSTIPSLASGVDKVVKKGGDVPLTIGGDKRYFVGYKDTGMYEITKNKNGLKPRENRVKEAYVKDADVTVSMYLYTDLAVNLYNPVHAADPDAFDFGYARVKNMDGEALSGESVEKVDVAPQADVSVLHKKEDIVVDTAKGGYYKFWLKGLSNQLADSAVVKISDGEAYRMIKLEVRPIIDLQLTTLSTTDSVSIKSVKFINGAAEEEYKTNDKLGIDIPTEFKKGDKKTIFAEATLTAKIPSLPLDNNESYYILNTTLKSGEMTKDVSLKVVLKYDGSVVFYGNDGGSFSSGAIVFANSKITFDYTKL